MPRLWNDTVKEHREAVRDAILDAMAGLIEQHGLSGVSMARIAKQTDIGRSTLYKYYPDIDAILADWHRREIGHHLKQIGAIIAEAGKPEEGLGQALETYGFNLQRGHGSASAGMLHQSQHLQHARHHLVQLIAQAIGAGVRTGAFRDDTPANELAEYCVHALDAARGSASKAAVRRLVGITLDALRTRAAR